MTPAHATPPPHCPPPFSAGRGNGIVVAVLSIVMALTACASLPTGISTDAPRPAAIAYIARDDGTLLARHAPVIVTPAAPAYNRIGSPAVRRNRLGRPEVYVDHRRPAFYVRQRSFEMGGARFTNLIYRIHFERVPYLHLTSGNNSGLLVVITLSSDGRPLLVTTVHTCGCYLAFVPTSYLPPSAWPAGWNPQGQRVFGIRLPGRLDYPADFRPTLRPLVVLRGATHRVTDLRLADLATGEGLAPYGREHIPLRPVTDLDRLPLPDGEGVTSFFHETGPSRGYVKNAFKPFELLLMSWWVLDPHVGMDKRYGPRDETGTVFYTSMWPWYRKASDMWEFPAFLDFWGWKLGSEDRGQRAEDG